MEVTISIDDELLERARRLAERRGTSLQELVREQLRLLGGERSGADAARELLEVMESHGGHSGGTGWRREDAYSGHVECEASSASPSEPGAEEESGLRLR